MMNREITRESSGPPGCQDGSYLAEEEGMSPTEIHALAQRVRSEFNEMPGLRLTLLQASRLWGLEPPACRVVIDALVGSSFLRWTRGGAIAKAEG